MKKVFAYGEVERILVAIHAQPESRLAAFRGRIKYLKKLGVPTEEGPGKGQRFQYLREHVWQLALALELEQFGISPEASAALAKDRGGDMYAVFKRAETELLFLHIDPIFFIPTNPKQPVLTARADPEPDIEIAFRPFSRDEAIKALDATNDDIFHRCGFINVTALVKAIEKEAAKLEQNTP